MVRTRDKDGSIIRRGQPSCRVPTSLHGELTTDLGRIPYFGLSPPSNGSPHGSHSPTLLPPSPHPPLTHLIRLPPPHPLPTIHLYFPPLFDLITLPSRPSITPSSPY